VLLLAKGRTSRHTWKSFERRVARFFGFERYSKDHLGDNVPDAVVFARFIKSVWLDIECKLHGSVSKEFSNALDQVDTNLTDDAHIPMVVIKEKHQPDDNAIVAMRWKHFKSLFDESFLRKMRRLMKEQQESKKRGRRSL